VLFNFFYVGWVWAVVESMLLLVSAVTLLHQQLLE